MLPFHWESEHELDSVVGKLLERDSRTAAVSQWVLTDMEFDQAELPTPLNALT
jgi:hypothetical protein